MHSSQHAFSDLCTFVRPLTLCHKLRQCSFFTVSQKYISLLQPLGGLRCFLTAWASICCVCYVKRQQKGVWKPNPKWGLPANQHCTALMHACMNTVIPTKIQTTISLPKKWSRISANRLQYVEKGTTKLRNICPPSLIYERSKCRNYILEPAALLFWNAAAIAIYVCT